MKFYTSFFKSRDTLCVRGYDGDEQFFEQLPIDNIVVYTEDHSNNNFAATQKSIYGVPLYEHRFNTIRAANEFVENNKFQNTWGYPRYEYAMIDDLYSGENDPSKVKICFIDIETAVGPDTDDGSIPEENFPSVFLNKHPITLITTCIGNKIVCLSTTELDISIIESHLKEHIPERDSYSIEYKTFKTEKLMLRDFIDYMEKQKPDIISGWNSNGFDLPYIYARIEKVLSKKFFDRISPFGQSYTREYINDFGEKALSVTIRGIESLDYLELYKKFELSPRENYKLETISSIETGAGKLHYDGSFRNFYLSDFSKFTAYNIIDVIRVLEIDQKVGFINLALQIAYKSKCNYTDVYPVTKIWDNIIANYCRSFNIQLPMDFKHEKEQYEGAYVKPTIPGKYEFLATFDVGSLYPSIIMQQNISTETLLEEKVDLTAFDVTNRTEKFEHAKARAKELNATLCADGSMFSRNSVGILPEVVEIYMKDRKTAKDEMQEWSKRIEYAKKLLNQRKKK